MCKCITKLNVSLAEHNTVVLTTLFSSWALISTVKDDPKKRGKPVSVVASYCPFCGKRYPERRALAPSPAQRAP